MFCDDQRLLPRTCFRVERCHAFDHLESDVCGQHSFSLASDGSFALKAFAIVTRKALCAAGSRENRIGAASNCR
jgi:hypothetical protein